jgi:hypothetical protein
VILIFCGLGGYFVALLAKTVLPLRLRAWAKLSWALVGSGGVAASLSYHHPLLLVSEGLGGAGLAVLAHRLSRMLLFLGDRLMFLSLRDRPRR